MSNTPLIRFAGFTDAWEQRKLVRFVLEGENEKFPKADGKVMFA